MMKINYSLIPWEKKRESGEYVVKNAFYMRDENERKPSQLYKGYHTDDYFGTSIRAGSWSLREDDDSVLKKE